MRGSKALVKARPAVSSATSAQIPPTARSAQPTACTVRPATNVRRKSVKRPPAPTAAPPASGFDDVTYG